MLKVALTTFTLFMVPIGVPFAMAETAPKDGLFADVPGRFWVDARYRYEWVQEDGTQHDAHSSTLRTRLGYETERYNGFAALAEYENTTYLGPEHFNTTANGKGGAAGYPIVADPETNEFHQLFVSYANSPNYKISLGRQRIVFDNGRFVAEVPFRQNGQTYDALRLDYTPRNMGLEATYAYVNAVQTTLGSTAPTGHVEHDTHLIHARYQTQSYNTHYYLAQLGVQHGLGVYTFGYEELGAENTLGESFRLPIGAPVRFNVISANRGMKNRYAILVNKLGYFTPKLKDTTFTAFYFDFNAANGRGELATELDFELKQQLTKSLEASIFFTEYNGQATVRTGFST